MRGNVTNTARLAPVAIALGLAGCGEKDMTALAGTEAASAFDPKDVERVLADHEAEVDRWIAEAQSLYGDATDAEVLAALGGAPLPSVEVLAEERRALARAALSEAERRAILELLGAGTEADASVTFHGRLAMRGHVLYYADDLLGSGDPERSVARVDKANLPLTFAPEDPTGMVPGGPPRPHQIAKVEDGLVKFWRADVGRRYFIVVPDDLPDSVFYGAVLAGYALERATLEDCIAPHTFTVIHQDKYRTLPAMARALSSVIELAYSTTACIDRADGCSNSPRLAKLTVSPDSSETRMRVASYMGLETDFDSPRDSDTLPDLTDAKVRDVVLHELGHLIGFDHPRYTELRPEIDTIVARVPQSSQGTVPTFMYPSELPLYSPAASAEDRRLLKRIYGGDCAYVHDFRALGAVCSTSAEQVCLRHGGSCEVTAQGDGTSLERCRWHNFTEPAACGDYSVGRWETSNEAAPETVLEGETGACISDIPALPPCTELSFMRTNEPIAGRCCAQFGTGDEGLFFEAFSDADASSYFCSDQKGQGEPSRGNWEFEDAADPSAFTTLDAASGASVPGWTLSSGDFVQELDQPGHLAVSSRRLRSGCISTQISSADDGESGIVFNFRTARNYYVFDAIPNVRRRIRQVVDRVSTDLLVAPWDGPTSWTDTTLTVCFGDGIHTFIDNSLSTRASVDGPVTFVGIGGSFGLWNDGNAGARHAFLHSQTLVEGYARLE